MSDERREHEPEQHGLLDYIFGRRLRVQLDVDAPGIERSLQHVANGLHAIARAIKDLAPPPNPIVTGKLSLPPQTNTGDTMIIKTLPQDVLASWAKADGSPGLPDSVEYSINDTSLGVVTPDPGDPTHKAVFVAATGLAAGDIPITFTAVAKQAGFPDVTATVSDTLTDAIVPPTGEIVSGALTLPPQMPVSAMAASIARARALGNRR